MLIYYHERSGIMFKVRIGSSKQSKSELLKQLNKYIEEFCKSYYLECERRKNIDGLDDDFIEEIKFLIDKLVSIYELKYPEHIIDILMKDIESRPSTFFEDHLDEVLGRDFGKKQHDIDWINIMNIEDILPSLDHSQRNFLKAPYSYSYQLCYATDNSHFKLKLGDDGRVKFLEISRVPGFEYLSNIDNKVLEVASNANGKTLREVLDELGKVGITGLDEYENISSHLEKWSVFRINFLNLVMIKMLLMGGSRIGGKRAFLFALENKLDISVPLKYGLDSSDPNERYFINEYLNAGGDPDLVCYINFLGGLDTYTETIRKRLQYRDASGKIPYTNEEKQLHSRLVLALTRHPNYKEQ